MLQQERKDMGFAVRQNVCWIYTMDITFLVSEYGFNKEGRHSYKGTVQCPPHMRQQMITVRPYVFLPPISCPAMPPRPTDLNYKFTCNSTLFKFFEWVLFPSSLGLSIGSILCLSCITQLYPTITKPMFTYHLTRKSTSSKVSWAPLMRSNNPLHTPIASFVFFKHLSKL